MAGGLLALLDISGCRQEFTVHLACRCSLVEEDSSKLTVVQEQGSMSVGHLEEFGLQFTSKPAVVSIGLVPTQRFMAHSGVFNRISSRLK